MDYSNSMAYKRLCIKKNKNGYVFLDIIFDVSTTLICCPVKKTKLFRHKHYYW